MDALEAVEVVLREAGTPRHHRDISERILARKLWTSEGKTPAATVNSRRAVDIQERGDDSRFARTSPGTFTLRAPTPAAPVLPGPLGGAKMTLEKKLGMAEIRTAARQIVAASPNGIRYGQLLSAILDQAPGTRGTRSRDRSGTWTRSTRTRSTSRPAGSTR